MNSEMINGLEILLEREEKYIQVNDTGEEGLRLIWPHLAENFPGFDIVFCFRNMEAPVGFLNEIGAVLLEDCIEIRLSSQDFSFNENGAAVELITPENFESFASLHDKTYPDAYWTSPRIRANFDLWRIFACVESGKVTDYAMLMPRSAELFCVHTTDQANAAALLSAAAKTSFENGAEELLYMIEENEKICQAAAESLGFQKCGIYKAYRLEVRG